MKEICLAGLGDFGIKISKGVSSLLSIPAFYIGKEKRDDIIPITPEKIALLESEKISTEYDDFLKNILRKYREINLLVVISDLTDGFSSSLTNLFGKFTKRLRIKTLGIFIFPFSSEGTRFNNAKMVLENIKENYDLIITLEKDGIFRGFKNIPIRYMDNLIQDLIYSIIKNIYESLSIQDFINMMTKAKVFVGFGVSSTDRMDKLADSYNEAVSSPWLKEDKGNTIIIFNGNLTENEINFLKSKIMYKNYNIKINRNINQGRRVDILILNF